jgi:hypothetical protein
MSGGFRTLPSEGSRGHRRPAEYFVVTSSRLRLIALAVCGCGLAVWVSFTKPFSSAADLVTAVPLAAMLVVQILLVLQPKRRSGADLPPRRVVAFSKCLVWITLSVFVVAFELYNYLSAPRSAHPTLSSLSDELSGHHLGKTLLFLAWLALGWLFVVASCPPPSPET